MKILRILPNEDFLTFTTRFDVCYRKITHSMKSIRQEARCKSCVIHISTRDTHPKLPLNFSELFELIYIYVLSPALIATKYGQR